MAYQYTTTRAESSQREAYLWDGAPFRALILVIDKRYAALPEIFFTAVLTL